MAKNTNPRKPTKEIHRTRRNHPSQWKEKEKLQQQPQQHIPSWAVMKNILTCKYLEVEQQQQQQATPHKKKHQKQAEKPAMEENNKKNKKMRCSGSLCNNTKVMQRPDPPSPEILQWKSRATPASSSSTNSSHDGSNRSIKPPVLGEISNHSNSSNNNNNSNNGVLLKSSSSNNANYSIKGMPFRRLSGCYECRMVVDPVLAFTRDPSLRATICSCPDCGEIFMKPENLELHQAVRHAGTSPSFFNHFCSCMHPVLKSVQDREDRKSMLLSKTDRNYKDQIHRKRHDYCKEQMSKPRESFLHKISHLSM